MMKVMDGLYLGNREAARDLRRLKAGGITHVVNCAEELPNYHSDEFRYLNLRLLDPDPRMEEKLPKAIEFIHDARAEGGSVLVHCFAAISRSPTVVLAYLAWTNEWELQEAAEEMGKLVWTDPDTSFLEQLARFRRTPLEPGQIRRIRMTLQGRPADAIDG